MSKLTGLNLEDMLNVTALEGVGQTQEPNVDQLLTKLRRFQRDKRILEEELEEVKSFSDSLRRELANLQTEAYQLEGIHMEREELCRKLQFQFEDLEQDSARQLNQSKKSEEMMEQYRCEIQEFKLKHRKQRMKFEQQLHQLIEQHKNLHSIFTLERLPIEIETAENRKLQLVSAEELKMAKLYELNEELEDVRKQKQSGTAAADTPQQ
ncbi:synaptonemal complex central element protein 1 isoform X1 [Solea senegalensis]|uniref:Synaptonemal complex central element protein 1 isoform X1 n=1 Tax=Solea senegalensis TaxID=28829 RepID=A0AAV6R7Q6_SOLSE|nr:synaptonemal complex central element protein 1 [Solea senegalensis]KAG7500569.1 synaptonemal complex central element protein 1 isoform X1 [Solea senegalensis]